MKSNDIISALELTKKFNISYQTMNYYTNLGLFVVRRREGNNRFYQSSDVRLRLKKITKLKNKGYPLRIIKTMI